MISIKLYHYENYKDYVNDWVRSHPNSGRGKYLEISKYLSIHTTLTSQIFKGQRDLNLDQAFYLCQYFGFSELETDYFLTLVQIDLAASFKLKEFYQEKLMKLQSELSQFKNQIKKKITLGDEQKALFYSNWFYSAIRLSTSIDSINSKEEIAEFLNLPLKQVSPIVDFLVKVSLLKEEGDKLIIGPTLTHLGSDSPLISNHHRNWRLKALDRHANLSEHDFCFSAPLTINSKDIPDVKEILQDTIKQISQIVQDSDNVDQLYCINLDWFSPLS